MGRTAPHDIRFASSGGPARLNSLEFGGVVLALGPVHLGSVNKGLVACDGDVWEQRSEFEQPLTVGTKALWGVVACRGRFTGGRVMFASIILADGDIDLTETIHIRDCLIRAGGEVHLRKDVKIVNSTVEGRAARPTAPYRFFELADAGLEVADDEEGLVVRAVAPETPFGACGLKAGDLIRAVDDAPAGGSEQFRRAVRRALVRQGDCLLTVARGDQTLDLPVFFPLPE